MRALDRKISVWRRSAAAYMDIVTLVMQDGLLGDRDIRRLLAGYTTERAALGLARPLPTGRGGGITDEDHAVLSVSQHLTTRDSRLTRQPLSQRLSDRRTPLVAQC
ncbi:MAG: hypothetical protein ACRDRI_07690 [Pseudonocardiaceae bacterium]